MAKKRASRRLVIDADVALSAGGIHSIHPTCSQCRALLRAVLKICHRVVMTEPIRREWRRHASRFSKRWLVSMTKRDKVVEPKGPCEYPRLRRRLASLVPKPAGLAAMQKDLHLVEAAIATDRVVISCDDKARGAFRRTAADIGALRSVAWVNPTETPGKVLKWLDKGAKVTKSMLLQ